MVKTNFGFKKVDVKEKEKLVQGVFSTVAQNYDLMNDLMSFGLHRRWKDKLISEIKPRGSEILLDMAGGTGDIARKFIKNGGKLVYLCDLNPQMLEVAEQKILDSYSSMLPNIKLQCENAEDLTFQDNYFDFYSIAFGIRNVTNIDNALKEAYRVLKPGGKFVCLELSNINSGLLKKLYDVYSFKIIPKIGGRIAGSADSYQYLVESIRKFPLPEKFSFMIEKAGFKKVSYQKLTFGVVAIHVGYK